MTTGIVWTFDCILFLALFVIWKRDDLFNLCLKMAFAMLAAIHAAPAFTFLQKTLN
ncbi:hypothetical protein SAMN05444159_1288 [Bradyrhizobium lablabi]|uniref:Uncharacterized protein n=1 Tax=Bradyrhizobium lablabi TaxID=722472 RepID=A0A1M6LIQ2_9BRAD|nr:hypothetical protein [Bradyrhizobium lablabi]SHJ71081.1 hypothetical protein SAMN05444159_1288 [Bradyrhizobium lablabi]